jgi:hypothetical protein
MDKSHSVIMLRSNDSLPKKSVCGAGHDGVCACPALGRLKQEDSEFEACLGYIETI